MVKSLQDTTTLHNGIKMPWFGLGVFNVKDGDDVIQSVKWALEFGYRRIDTASIYKNEEGVGKAIRDSNVAREDIFVTSKVWNSEQGYESTIEAFHNSLNRLSFDYLDLYLIHWPVKEKYKETWKALEYLYNEGKVKAIGVSNFKIHHLEDLMKDAEIKPMVNQVELHPRLTQKELREYCQKHQIQIEAWSPLMHGKLLNHEVLVEIGKKYNKTPAQVILRWDLQSGIMTIPKSTKRERIIENASIFDFKLSKEDMEKIDALNCDERFGPDPDHFDF